MKEVSTREAARNLYRLLDAAKDGPVVITRYGRKRAAIVNAEDFDILMRLLRRHKDIIAGRCLEGAIEKIADGHFNKALKLRHAALLLGGILK